MAEGMPGDVQQELDPKETLNSPILPIGKKRENDKQNALEVGEEQKDPLLESVWIANTLRARRRKRPPLL